MNLHLDNINPFCKCRQDGIRMSPESPPSPRAKSARNITSRPQSQLSPRPPSACGVNNKRIRNNVTQSDTATNSINSSKKVLLRYTDGGIKRPITPQIYTGTNPLPRLVKRYIGRRVGQYHELSVAQNSAIFIDTSQLNGALSIVSHGYCSK
ncbi:hypothetical protein ACF0H5_013823 [Mactra antiquata]